MQSHEISFEDRSFLMPGTIQISVLEFKGLPAESSPSLLKVSLGKREYQTSDMNGFSFPLTTLRDDLVVALDDAEGNELAHLGIRTMSIVEKVSWDDIFPLEGGGYLHLKLMFMLSQQEKTRIRTMREAALKEKKEFTASGLTARVTNKVNVASPSSSSHAEQTVTDSQTSSVQEFKNLDDSVQAGSLSNPGVPRDIQEPDFVEEERTIPIKEIPKEDGGTEKAGSDPSGHDAETRPVKKIDTQSLIHPTRVKSLSREEEDLVEKSEQHGSRKKNVSKVKIIANAFESGLPKDVKYPLSPSAVKSGGKKFSKGDHPKEYEPTDSLEERDISSGLVAEGNNKISVERSVDDVESQAAVRSKEKGISTANSDTLSTRETDTNHRTEQSPSLVIDPNVYSDSDRSLTSETATTPEEERRKDSNEESIPLEYREEDVFLRDKSEIKPYQDEKISNIHGDPIECVQHGTDEEKVTDSNGPEDTKKSIPDSPSNDGWNGLVAQAVKVALIVGFGVLVFLNRQRQPRKTSKDERGLHIFKPSEYMNDEAFEAEKWID